MSSCSYRCYHGCPSSLCDICVPRCCSICHLYDCICVPKCVPKCCKCMVNNSIYSILVRILEHRCVPKCCKCYCSPCICVPTYCCDPCCSICLCTPCKCYIRRRCYSPCRYVCHYPC